MSPITSLQRPRTAGRLMPGGNHETGRPSGAYQDESLGSLGERPDLIGRGDNGFG